MSSLRLVLLLGLAALACAAQQQQQQQRTENALMAGQLGWIRLQGADPDSDVTLTFCINHRPESRARLHEIFTSVSDPKSPGYGRHLSDRALAGLMAPRAEDLRAVHKVLSAAGVTQLRLIGTGDMLRATMTVRQAEQLFGITIETFEHTKTGAVITRSLDELSLPAELEAAVELVYGLSSFPNLHIPQKSEKVGAPQVNAALIKKLYSINETFSTRSNSSQALAEFQGQGFLPSDLAAFEQKNNLPAQKARNISGSAATSTAGVEASLDIQYIVAAGTGIPTDFYLQDGQSFDLMGWAAAIFEYPSATRPLVWSVSYGEGINGGIGGKIAVSEAQRLDAEFQKLATLGVSVVIASGDAGVYDRIPFQILKFHPSFPACLPSATAVGATILDNNGDETKGWTHSGGGFTPSEYFTRANATWQESAVQGYLKSGVHLPVGWAWDKNGRGLPDVSAVGVDFAVVVNGMVSGVSGTSASTPVVAGIMALLNDARMATGKPPLGFLNPFLYQNADGFRDITAGKNDNGDPLLGGFEATKGWDPVTGLGTPNYEKLRAAAINA